MISNRARAACESTLFERLEATGVATEMVAINSTGCFLTVHERVFQRVRTAAASLNVAPRLRPACACVTLVRAETNSPLPSLANVLATFCAHALEALHITATPARLTSSWQWPIRMSASRPKS